MLTSQIANQIRQICAAANAKTPRISVDDNCITVELGRVDVENDDLCRKIVELAPSQFRRKAGDLIIELCAVMYPAPKNVL